MRPKRRSRRPRMRRRLRRKELRMCDTFIALPAHTRNQTMLFAKSADCEVNEANALVRIPHQKHIRGEAVRITHLVIPQAEETFEILLTKAFCTYCCDIF